MASCLRGALPPVDFLAVCLVRAMAIDLFRQLVRLLRQRDRCELGKTQKVFGDRFKVVLAIYTQKLRANSTACVVGMRIARRVLWPSFAIQRTNRGLLAAVLECISRTTLNSRCFDVSSHGPCRALKYFWGVKVSLAV